MQSRHLFVTSIIAFLLWGLSLSAIADMDEWQRYQTSNFTIYSDKDADDVEEVLSNFEIFRATVNQLVSIKDDAVLAPATIYMFNSSADFRRFTKSRNTAGYYVNSSNGPIMVVGPKALGIDSMSVLYHEYIHYLVRARSPMKYPTWYDEGIAEFFSTIKIGKDKVTIGGIPKHRETMLISFRPMALEELFSLSNTYSNSSFKADQIYSSAWLAVNFLTLSKLNGGEDFAPPMKQFLARFNNGVEWREAFDQSFDISLEQLDEKMRAYGRKSRLVAAQLDLPNVKTTVQKTPLSEGQALSILAQMASLSGSQELSAELIEEAFEKGDPTAKSVRAVLFAATNQPQLALALIEEVETETAKHPWVHFYAGKTYSLMSKNGVEGAKNFRAKAFEHFKLLKERQISPLVLTELIDLYWRTGDKQQAIDELVQLVNLMPSSIEVNLMAGEYMAKVDSNDYAQYFLQNVLAWSHNPKYTVRARSLLKKL